MNRRSGKFKEGISNAGSPAENWHRKDSGASYSNCSRNHYLGDGSMRTYGLLIMISVIALLVLIPFACGKADFSLNASSEDSPSIKNQSVNQTGYLSGFNEGYYLGGLFVIAQSNATIAEEYNFLVQKHNDFINKTLSEEGAESNRLAKVPMPSMAPSKPRDPWDL